MQAFPATQVSAGLSASIGRLKTTACQVSDPRAWSKRPLARPFTSEDEGQPRQDHSKSEAKNVKVLLCGMLAPPTLGADYQRDFANAFPDLADKHKVAYLPFLLDTIAMKKGTQPSRRHPSERAGN
jgi:hypothetical protein